MRMTGWIIAGLLIAGAAGLAYIRLAPSDLARWHTDFPEGLPAGLSPMFATDPAKIRGWQSFWKKAGLKDDAPALDSVIQLLVGFLERPLESAAKGKPLSEMWKRNRWLKD